VPVATVRIELIAPAEIAPGESVQLTANAVKSGISAIFSATVQATEEAIVNALVAGETMRGADGRIIPALPHDAVTSLMKKYGR